MKDRLLDGSAGDADYGRIGTGYSDYRQPEPQIAARINEALGLAREVLNVGAGAGSYEPLDRKVVALEPSASMRARRPPSLSPAIDGMAEKIPFADGCFDASMATFTVHQWSDLTTGLAEMRRVSRGPVIVLTCDPNEVQRFWLNAYAPEVLATEARRYPSIATIVTALGGVAEVISIHIPLNCKDGFNEAYYGRPERLLEAGARTACSAWSFVAQTVSDSYIQHLTCALKEGAWDSAYGHLRSQKEFHGSLRLIVARRV
jgi:hypothetical protein